MRDLDPLFEAEIGRFKRRLLWIILSFPPLFWAEADTRSPFWLFVGFLKCKLILASLSSNLRVWLLEEWVPFCLAWWVITFWFNFLLCCSAEHGGSCWSPREGICLVDPPSFYKFELIVAWVLTVEESIYLLESFFLVTTTVPLCSFISCLATSWYSKYFSIICSSWEG